MFEVFFTEIVDPEWGNYFLPTTWGYMALVVIMLLALLLAAYCSKNIKLGTKQLVFCSMAMALGFITSNIKLLDMPMGGSITLLSMLFISLIGYWYGPRTGILAAVSYGLLQLIIDPYVISLPQLFFDYIFAFGALGLSGFFKGSKNGLYKGYLCSILGRFVFAFISGVAFFGSSAAGYGLSVPVYSALYNGGYIFSEAILTLVIIALPPVKNALYRLKVMAN